MSSLQCVASRVLRGSIFPIYSFWKLTEQYKIAQRKSNSQDLRCSIIINSTLRLRVMLTYVDKTDEFVKLKNVKPCTRSKFAN